MDYIKLINRFWQLRRSKRITNLQADLYYYLLQECNARYWENPFQCSNTSICASISITEKTLIDARNRLKQLGLIRVTPGITKKRSPTYFLTDSLLNVSIEVSNPGGNEGGNEANIIKNQTKEKLQEGQNDLPPPAPKKNLKKVKEPFVPPTLQEAKNFFQEQAKTFWPAPVANQEATDFIDHYEANGWVQNKGKPIVKWQAAAHRWINRAKTGEFKSGKGAAVVPASAEAKGEDQLGVEIEQLYQEFKAGDRKLKSFTTEHYELLKTMGIAKLPQPIIIQIQSDAIQRRMNMLTGSNKADDLRLLDAYQSGSPSELIDQDRPRLNIIQRKLALMELFQIRMKKAATEFFEKQSA